MATAAAAASSFPSPLERTVVSALLLLSNPPSKQGKTSVSQERLSFTFSTSSSSSSSSSSHDDVDEEDEDQSKSSTSSLTTMYRHLSSRNQKIRIIAAVARFHEIKLKVVKKRRSKIYRSFADRKISSNMASTETSSCLSSSSSGISSARSHREITAKAEKVHQGTKQIRKRCSGGGSTHMRRRAEAILKLLSGGCSSELNIRRLLGDSPDTSKALRMLLKQEEVKRSGTGGPKDPYVYTIA